MTRNKDLSAILERNEAEFNETIAELERQSAVECEAFRERRERAIEEAGRTLCSTCGGNGVLRDLSGCENCGGDYEKRGRGFI